MGDHFVLLVDRLLTESTLDAALESRNRSMDVASSSVERDTEVVDVSLKMISQGKLVECRICHEEDEVYNMEIPCACCGSLKYAHRKCIQRWCNQKGNTKCEICLQQYKPGYRAPPPLFQFGRIPMNFRGNWAMSRRDLHSTTRYVHAVSHAQSFRNFNYDQYSPSPSVVLCSVTTFFMVLLVLSHTLPLLEMIDNVEYSIPLLMLLLMGIVGILVLICVTLRTVTFIMRLWPQEQHQREPSIASGNLSDIGTAFQPLPQVSLV